MTTATTGTAPAVTYRKTQNGQWVACGPASIVRPGATITVTKRDGTTKTETIAATGREFDRDGVTCVYGYLSFA